MRHFQYSGVSRFSNSVSALTLKDGSIRVDIFRIKARNLSDRLFLLLSIQFKQSTIFRQILKTGRTLSREEILMSSSLKVND